MKVVPAKRNQPKHAAQKASWWMRWIARRSETATVKAKLRSKTAWQRSLAAKEKVEQELTAAVQAREAYERAKQASIIAVAKAKEEMAAATQLEETIEERIVAARTRIQQEAEDAMRAAEASVKASWSAVAAEKKTKRDAEKATKRVDKARHDAIAAQGKAWEYEALTRLGGVSGEAGSKEEQQTNEGPRSETTNEGDGQKSDEAMAGDMIFQTRSTD